jgi:hypothetical protein
MPASGNADGSAENTALPPAPRGPVQVELIPPTPPAPMPRQPTDIPSDNPLYSIPQPLNHECQARISLHCASRPAGGMRGRASR